MRRVLLLAMLLAAPALARPQTAPAGSITFTNTNADPSATTINLAECNGTSGTKVQISWTVTVFGTNPGTNITYQLWASNKESTTNDCPKTQPDTTTSASFVGQITNQSATSLVNQEFDPILIASALKITSSNPCSLTADTPIFLCVNAMSGGTDFGVARGKVTLSTSLPDVKPTLNTPIQPGNTALTPTWNDNNSTNTQWYRVQAISMADPSAAVSAGAFDPGGGYAGFDASDTARHFSDYVSGTQVRIGGLKNGVTYAVAVTGYTAAYNPSDLDATGIGTGTPQFVTDFWQTYKDAGGRETGGCSSGVAGPLALALLAGALALARRRK